jgi:hypothetical protein
VPLNHKSRLISASGGLLLCFAIVVSAQCEMDSSPPCQVFWRAQVVFSGVVTRASYSETYAKGEGDDRWNYRDRIAHFTVEETFRGKVGPEVDVIATEILPTPTTLADGSPGVKAMSDFDCDYKFKQGARYLVYAQVSQTNDGSLRVGFNRTRPLAQAADDLEFIRGLDGSEPGGRIYGQAKQIGPDPPNRGTIKTVGPVAMVKVVVEGLGRHYETSTDSEGRYQIKGLKPGEYSVQALFPEELASPPVQKTRIEDKGCAHIDFAAETNGRISGKVFDAAGQPMPKMRLDLAFADQDANDPNPQTFWAYADETGNYEFNRIPPGRYVLGIRLNAIRDFDFAYPRTYYPAAISVSDARVFTLKAGEKISGVNFSMPTPLTLRTVAGIVIWPDGRPVHNAGITVMISDYAYGMGNSVTSTDQAGRFSFQLFAGLSYWLNAVVNLPGGKQMHAEPVDIPSEGDLRELKLVVESSGGSCDRCRFRYGPKKKP